MKLFFNSSLPRSGSTLLQNILAQNPDFHCSPTSGVIEMIDAARKAFTDGPLFKVQPELQKPEAFYSFCRGAMEGYYSAITDKPFVMDKSRGWLFYYDWLKGIYPGAKVVVCIRDIRAILSSMEKLHRKNPHLSDPAMNPGAMQFLTVDQRVQHWMTNPPVGLSLATLMDAIQKGNDKHCHFLIYEKLVKNPAAEVVALYDYLGLNYFEHDYSNVSQLIEENDAEHGIYGDHKILPMVSPPKRDWNEVIGKEICNTVMMRNQWFYDRFYKD